ncbi:phosphoribosylglycinamide formyltransferase [Leptospira sp. GIMC2001]|uniref:phosphoribosylglycinamide formyltransferase n=1 Tax=Leptospira sp. GIMC2001 TaxID=1513297 RepID=UPI00234935FE|nr:phosphoribosylglycinamide formyltransferase [Leptospira sp. GIMC2001]WCL50936.1 phosphoribosylglycinamide formyltransferase [Leptospira sp. GIMC2001]
MASLFRKKSQKRVVFLASGRGSNFEACAVKIKDKTLSCEPVGLITDNAEAKAILIAKKYKIPTYIVDYKGFGNRSEFNSALANQLDELRPDLIVTVGFMKILPQEIVKTYKNRIINIHPSLLPAFPGINSQRQAIEYGAKISGCTVHFIDEGVDTGAIILQSPVTIESGMTESQLSLKILKEEHKILPKAIQYFLNDKIKIEGRKVRLIK